MKEQVFLSGYRIKDCFISNCKFEDNITVGIGGAIWVTRTANIYMDNCSFYSNSAYNGGAIYLMLSLIEVQNPSIITNCTFVDNNATNAGGALRAYSKDNLLVLKNNKFQNNNARIGGAIACSSNISVINNIFSNNTASEKGGAIHNDGFSWNENRSLVIVNSTFYNNESIDGDAIACELLYNNYIDYGIEIYNSIFWDTDNENEFWTWDGELIDVQYSCIRSTNIYQGTGNINLDPLFESPSSENFHIAQSSPCYNAGFNGAPNLPSEDFEGNSRIFNEIVDMGAYENQEEVQVNNIIYVNENTPAQIFDQDGASWATAFANLQDALDIAISGNEIWVAQGTYIPTTSTITSKDEYAKYIDRSEALYYEYAQNATCNSSIETEVPEYSPIPIDSYRLISFGIVEGVAMYGGFSGWETELEQRDFETNVTILSGEIGNSGTHDNIFHVLYANNITEQSIIDGFTITRGNPVGSTGFSGGTGGGLCSYNSNLLISNCNINQNTNTAIWSSYDNLFITSSDLSNNLIDHSSPSICGGAICCQDGILNVEDSRFYRNFNMLLGHYFAPHYGGAIFATNTIGNLRNCYFSYNVAGACGGALYILTGCSFSLQHCIFAKNHAGLVCATGYGGAIFTQSHGDLTIDFCTFFNNKTPDCTAGGNSIKCLNGTPNISNSIFYDSDLEQHFIGSGISAEYSDIYPVSTTITTTDCISEIPEFVNEQSNDYHLLSRGLYYSNQLGDWTTGSVCSPCINAGNPFYGTYNEPDQGSEQIVNMGAYGNTQYASYTCPPSSSEEAAKSLLCYFNENSVSVYPNPFDNELKIDISIADDSNIELIVYDITGKQQCKIINNFFKEGEYNFTWNGKSQNNDLPNGVYYLQIRINNETSIEKIVLSR